ncbi:hypothetical protein GLYMA_13G203600v4 [Glycine max]|uniref:ADP/ATP translocase n=1 Tax=Glycine max TaxID=3847 RepID=A0A0R0H3N5_SOYBN|nr:hypothetical protein GLYMA_13G203600v4 [Glycine max]
MCAISAVVSVTAAAPIARVKLLIQNQNEIIKVGRLYESYKGIGDCFKRTIQEEGVFSLWRGNTASVIRHVPAHDKDGYWKWFFGNLASGGAAGASSLLFIYCLDYARTGLANDVKKGGERQFNGLVDVYGKTYASDGIAGLYRGFNITCVGVFVYRGLFFGLYDSLRPALLVGNFQLGSFADFSIAFLACCSARRRMMMTSGEAVKYKSSMDAFAQILENEGAKSL